MLTDPSRCNCLCFVLCSALALHVSTGKSNWFCAAAHWPIDNTSVLTWPLTISLISYNRDPYSLCFAHIPTDLRGSAWGGLLKTDITDILTQNCRASRVVWYSIHQRLEYLAATDSQDISVYVSRDKATLALSESSLGIKIVSYD